MKVGKWGSGEARKRESEEVKDGSLYVWPKKRPRGSGAFLNLII